MPCIRYAILPLNTDYREDDGTIRYSILGYYVIECQLLKTTSLSGRYSFMFT